MIDTHIHLVPGVDDGAKDMDVAIRMLHMAINEGVSEMILTPHFNIPIYYNQNVEKQYNLIKDYIITEKIDLKIHLGNEIYLSEESMEGIKNGQAHTMGDSRYLLVELPYYHFYPFHEAMMHDLQLSGYKIVLAHAERYQIFMKKPDKIKELAEKGIYAQITSSYIIDKKTRKKALKWIEGGSIHIVASDGHNVDNRPPVMKRAYDSVSQAFGELCAETLFVDNPRLMIEDGALMIADIEKARRFGLRMR
ncbi:tyrosine-protein phosphatase [Acetobacterium sp.]|uniref:tyrosine-protein phosphatase n=1 Tax=Acetobacterium sp. TaxID=1872094 RepID=UPI002F421180